MPADDLRPLHESFFNTIYDQYKDRLYGYILAIVHSPEVAEDITHELFVRIWTDRQSLGHVNNIEHYLFARSEEHTSELQSLMRISYAVFCLKKKKHTSKTYNTH